MKEPVFQGATLPSRWSRRQWQGLGISAALHLLLVLTLTWRSAAADGSSDQVPNAQTQEQVTLIPLNPAEEAPAFVPPPPPPPPPPPAPAPPPPPPVRQPPKLLEEVMLGPNSDRPDERPQDGDRKPEIEKPDRDPDGIRQPDPVATEPPSARARRIERASEYFQRLGFVESRLLRPQPKEGGADTKSNSAEELETIESTNGAPRFGPSTLDRRRWQNSNPTAAGQCPEIPDLGVDESGKPKMASVVGRILAQDRRGPLIGAHLQLVGTAFVTFTDQAGEYVLRFDPKTLAHCRTQYVRVTAPGFRTELLVLSIGPRVRSDDVVLRRK